MQHGFWGRYSFISVAVDFDEHTAALVRVAEALCRRSGKKLCLLHAVDPGQQRSAASSRLAEVEALVGGGVQVLKEVVQGRPREVLASAAHSVGSCLLLLGLSYERARHVPLSFSTALSLVSDSPVPIMILDGTTKQAELPMDKLHVLLADDLAEKTEATVAFAFDLAGSGTDTERRDAVTHLHVSGLTREVIGAALGAAMASEHSLVDPESLSADVYACAVEAFRSRLEKRAEPYLEYFEEAGGAYRARLAEGAVEEEILQAVRELEPDVLLFARHHPYHTKPLHVGRVPYRAMLASQRPVIVVPDA
jgi:nucleotide-binding universal stress UspA family protein